MQADAADRAQPRVRHQSHFAGHAHRRHADGRPVLAGPAPVPAHQGHVDAQHRGGGGRVPTAPHVPPPGPTDAGAQIGFGMFDWGRF